MLYSRYNTVNPLSNCLVLIVWRSRCVQHKNALLVLVPKYIINLLGENLVVHIISCLCKSIVSNDRISTITYNLTSKTPTTYSMCHFCKTDLVIKLWLTGLFPPITKLMPSGCSINWAGCIYTDMQTHPLARRKVSEAKLSMSQVLLTI